MRIFVAANEAIGTRLVRKLIDRGRAMVGASPVSRRGQASARAWGRAGRARRAQSPAPSNISSCWRPKRALAGRPIDKEER